MRAWSLCLLGLVLTGCAWTNRANRPVWNVLEANLVPEDELWFALALPLTLPAGLAAVLVDSLVAHPLQVVGDAADDAIDLWRDSGSRWEAEYYTQMALLPLRAVATPVVFLGSFLGRSAFDVSSDSPEPVDLEEQMARAVAGTRRWLRAIAAGEADDWWTGVPDIAWDDELQRQLAVALDQGSAFGRSKVYRWALSTEVSAEVLAPEAGLTDPDPVVRHRVLEFLPRRVEIDPEVIRALRADPSEWLRLQARLRWPDDR